MRVAAVLALLVATAAPAYAHHGPPYLTGPDHEFGEMVEYPLFFPLDRTADYHFSDTFYSPRCCDPGEIHHAQDLMTDKMVEVYAVASGTIHSVNWSWTAEGIDPTRCCTIALDHDDGWSSWYIHLNNDTPGTDDGQGWGIAPGILPGVHVDAGQLLGWVGDSGNAENTDPHLHYELRDPNDVIVNPYQALLDAEANPDPEPPAPEPEPSPEPDPQPVIEGVTCMGLDATIVGDADGDGIIWGTDGDDVIVGTKKADDIRAGDGNDVVCGLKGDDTIDGGNGDDTLNGGIGNDLIVGRDGADRIYGKAGHDLLFGGNGDDILKGGSGDDLLNGGSDDDKVNGAGGNDTLEGEAGNDVLTLGKGDDEANAGAGDDRIRSGLGANSVDGSAGWDIIDYRKAPEGITVDLSAGVGGNDTLQSIEEVVGSEGNDTLIGTDSAEILKGRGGDDIIEGLGGDDTLIGNGGNDTANGGTGEDLCVTETASDCEK